MFNLEDIFNKELIDGFYEILEVNDSKCIVNIEFNNINNEKINVSIEFTGIEAAWSYFIDPETKDIVDIEFPPVNKKESLHKLVYKGVSAGNKYGFTSYKQNRHMQCGFYADSTNVL